MNTILTRYELKAALIEALPVLADDKNTSIDLPDSTYMRMSERDISGKLAKFLKDTLAIWGLDEWREDWDCDNFAKAASLFADGIHSHAVRNGKSTAQAAAFGCLSYVTERGTGHRINVALTERGIRFWEPQNQTFIELTDFERSMVWYATF